MDLSLSSFPLAMKDYFGLNSRGISEFMAELRALTDGDKTEFRSMLKEVGYKLP